jgi:hypothetical protein
MNVRVAASLLFLASLLSAQETPTGENAKRIAGVIPLTFTDRCDAKQAGDVKPSLSKYFFNVVGGGLDALERYDPNLVEDVYRTVNKVPLTIDCDPNDGTRYLRHSVLFWGKRRINIKEVGESLRRVRKMPGPDKKQIGPAWNFEMESGTMENKNRLFHEFLHHAGIMGLSDHNDLAPGAETVNRRQLDRAYSCAGLAFPSERVFVAWEAGRRYGITAQACRACLQRARDECAEFPEGPAANVKVKPPKGDATKAFRPDL